MSRSVPVRWAPICVAYPLASALKYAVGVVPNVFLNMEMNALGVL